MTTRETAPPEEAADGAPASVDSFLEAKLHWPPARPEWLTRQRLLDRIAGACEHPVTLVAAPAGYGKTILLTQWLTQEQPRAAWVSLDAGDNDPSQLWTHVAAALDRAGCRLDPELPPGWTGTDAVAPGPMVPAVVAALATMREDLVVVLDDFQFIRDTTCHAQVELLIEHLPPQAHLVLLTRADPGLRLGRLRAAGGLLEIRADDLRFTTDEAAGLLARAPVVLGDHALDLLMQRTEGWPAGLYLASLSLTGRTDPDAFVRTFSGADRYIGDYLTEEVLGRHSDRMRDFILTVSILDRFSAALCDHVAGITGSGSILRELEHTNLFLVPLDGDGRWYRFHHLFGAVARAELEVAQPQRLQTLHTRAADWFGARGSVDEAIRHSIAGGDTESAALLVQAHWLQFVDAGRAATVQGWLQAIGPPTEATDPAASVTTAWMAALIGDEATLAARSAALQAFHGHGPLPDGSRSVESALAMIQGLFGYGGPVEMMRGAELAVALETDRHSPFHALANVSLGHAAYVAGQLDRAVTPLADAARNDRAPVIVRALALATESLVQDERANIDRSRECAEQAMALLEAHGLPAMPQASLVHTALGRAQANAAQLDEALATLDRSLALGRAASAYGPWGMVHHLVTHAAVAAAAGRSELAGSLLLELDARSARFTDGMEAMTARTAAVRHLTQNPGGVDPAEGEPLTGREIDVLRLLQGTLSLQEIADELYLSFNTVKTHARAVYRKLGVHTRAEAVLTGRQQGLV